MDKSKGRRIGEALSLHNFVHYSGGIMLYETS